MKSVIQEATTLTKAIEKGWNKAGSPRDFSVKILQESHTNFLGITTQNAKIAIFFGDLEHKPTMPQHNKGRRRKPGEHYKKTAQNKVQDYRRPYKKSNPIK